ncbi:hypothetical protein QE152_g28561 [Popillia japonica]|uniref:Uncharacterized protein n=1 Tax=Popillia japonica TaxID=7064 RepID=A0AAW1JJ37_POPJA
MPRRQTTKRNKGKKQSRDSVQYSGETSASCTTTQLSCISSDITWRSQSSKSRKEDTVKHKQVKTKLIKKKTNKMEYLSQPKEMVMTGDLAANWRKFRNNYETFMIATGANKKAVEVQAAVLTHCMGEEVRSILDTLDISAEQKQDPKYILEVLQQYFIPKTNILEVLQQYFIPKTNISIERHRFNSTFQFQNTGR